VLGALNAITCVGNISQRLRKHPNCASKNAYLVWSGD
jgi:hypothetical protein